MGRKKSFAVVKKRIIGKDKFISRHWCRANANAKLQGIRANIYTVMGKQQYHIKI